MTVVSIVLILAAGTPTSEVMQAASDCSIGNIVIGAPSRLAWLLDESDLPVIVTETVVTDFAWFTYESDDGPWESYDEYEVSHTYEVEPADCVSP